MMPILFWLSIKSNILIQRFLINPMIRFILILILEKSVKLATNIYSTILSLLIMFLVDGFN